MLGTRDISAGSISSYDIIISTEYLSRVKYLKTLDLDRYAYLDDAHYMYALCFVDQPPYKNEILRSNQRHTNCMEYDFFKNGLKNTKIMTKKKYIDVFH